MLGKTGNIDGDQVIDVLFEQEAAARYVPSKLWSYFVEDEAPEAIVKTAMIAAVMAPNVTNGTDP